jgi:hypothetical protein
VECVHCSREHGFRLLLLYDPHRDSGKDTYTSNYILYSVAVDLSPDVAVIFYCQVRTLLQECKLNGTRLMIFSMRKKIKK